MGLKYPLRERSLEITPGSFVENSGRLLFLSRLLKFGIAILNFFIEGALISIYILARLWLGRIKKPIMRVISQKHGKLMPAE